MTTIEVQTHVERLTRESVQQRTLKIELAIIAWQEAVCLEAEETFWKALAQTNKRLAEVFLEDLYVNGSHNDTLSETKGYPILYGNAREVLDQHNKN